MERHTLEVTASSTFVAILLSHLDGEGCTYPEGRPEIIEHRGASDYVPEIIINFGVAGTIEAIRAAVGRMGKLRAKPKSIKVDDTEVADEWIDVPDDWD